MIWNLNLLSQVISFYKIGYCAFFLTIFALKLLKAYPSILIEQIDKIKELINCYRNTVNMNCIQHLMNCYNCLIASLTNVYPMDNSSFVYCLNYDNEKEFFSKHLPIRVKKIYDLLIRILNGLKKTYKRIE